MSEGIMEVRGSCTWRGKYNG